MDWFDVKPVLMVTQDANGNPQPVTNLDGLLRVLPSPTPELTTIDGGTVTVSTLTPLKAFTNLLTYNSLYFYVINRDDVLGNTNDVFLLVECSNDGEREDAQSWEIQIAAGKQGRVLVPPGFFTTHWRLSAYSTSPSFPTVPIQWGIKGIAR